jgi:hypothetical protein
MLQIQEIILQICYTNTAHHNLPDIYPLSGNSYSAGITTQYSHTSNREAGCVLCNQIKKVSPAEADTYKCFAVNEYGRAICTATLNVIEGKGYITCSLDWE